MPFPKLNPEFWINQMNYIQYTTAVYFIQDNYLVKLILHLNK